MATTTVTPEMEAMSLDDLRKAAEAEAVKSSTTTTTEEEEKEILEEEEEEEVVVPQTYHSERTIDLGDGAGVQVFKGKGTTREEALDDLADKMADAQRNATKKIRELTKAAPAPVNKENESLLSAELLASPTATINKILKNAGLDPDEIKQTTATIKQQKIAAEKTATADAFVAANPDFADTPHNGKLINQWCKLHNDFSLEGFNKAYQDLNESGLLQVKSEEASTEQKEAAAEAQRIADAAKVTSSQRTKKSSGLSTQRRTPVVTNSQTSEDDMYSMPLDELRKAANKQLAGA